MNFGAQSLGSSIATFGGQGSPMCNYTSPLAKKFIYKESSNVVYPLRKYLFKLKVRTAAELRFHEIQKRYMLDKSTGKKFKYVGSATNVYEMDHLGTIIPKDEYEVRKFTSYMTSYKMSKDYKELMQENWVRVLFMSESHNHVGAMENVNHQAARPATDEEFMAWFWYLIMSTTCVAFVVTFIYWWWKYGQTPQYMELK